MERPVWHAVAARLARAVEHRPELFLPKDRWSMDWYYPVLTGIVTGEAAVVRLDRGWERFVLDGLGVRCVGDRPWVTTGETCEAAMAHLRAGLDDRARQLYAWSEHLRANDGSYFTGMVHPGRITFPAGERTTYSAAAAVLAADALAGTGPQAGLFGCRAPVGGARLAQG
jgi:hypothetical protein